MNKEENKILTDISRKLISMIYWVLFLCSLYAMFFLVWTWWIFLNFQSSLWWIKKKTKFWQISNKLISYDLLSTTFIQNKQSSIFLSLIRLKGEEEDREGTIDKRNSFPITHPNCQSSKRGIAYLTEGFDSRMSFFTDFSDISLPTRTRYER